METAKAAAITALVRSPHLHRACDWPFHDNALGEAGLYAWYVDREGAADLSVGLGHTIQAGLIYIGQTGATKTVSGRTSSMTLGTRIGSHHISGRIRSSTFRLTLAASLVDVLHLRSIGPKALDPESNAILSTWIKQHLSVALFAFFEREQLESLERSVLASIDPVLNLEHCSSTSLRRDISEGRKALCRFGKDTGRPASSTEARSRPRGPDAPKKHSATPTLHSEIAAILKEADNVWMSTKELAEAVNNRQRYHKKDGTLVAAFQIHGRTRKYHAEFERVGSKVRLREPSSK